MSAGLPLNPHTSAKLLNSNIVGKLATGAKLISSLAPAGAPTGGILASLGAAGPIALGIGALGALGYGGYKMYKHWKDKKGLPHAAIEQDIVQNGKNGRKIHFTNQIYNKGRNLYQRGAEWTDTKGRELMNKGLAWSASTGKDLFNRGANWSNTRGRQLLTNGLQAGKRLTSDVVKFART